MELNNKEKKIKQVLSELNYEVDTDFLWKDVSKELDKEKKKKRFFWIFPLLGLALIAFLFFNNFGVVENHSIENEQKNLSVSNIDAEDKELKHDVIIKNNEALRAENQKDIKTKELNQNSKNTNTTKKSSSNNHSSLAHLSDVSSSIKQNKNSYPFKNSTSKINTRSTANIIDSRASNNLFNNTITKETRQVISNPSDVVNSKIKTNLKNKLEAVLLLNKQGINPFNIEERTQAALNLSASEMIKVDPVTKRVFLAVGAGTIKDISRSLTASDQVPAKLFDRETALWGINTGVQVGMEFKNKIKVFGGFDYAQLVTQYQNTDFEDFEGEQVAELESINANNNYTSIEGVLASTTKIENDILWHRHHNSLDFQLGVSKDLLPKSNFILAPEVSLLQNLYTSHKGYYFNEQTPNFVKFERGEESPYRKNTGLKTQLGLNLGYETSQYQFAINTSWRNPLTPITNETNNFLIKNSQLSIQARVNCLLNWEKN